MKTTLRIQNINCGGCLTTIATRLSEINNISDIFVSIENKTVSFEYNTHHELEKTKHVLSMIGYPVIGMDNH
ncbi:MAG TPA: heavy-metal-associated domain-containing protein [Xanthomarina sp.]|nr:heavy-metal-associated domain-containing protein [Xanthomarina sp.]